MAPKKTKKGKVSAAGKLSGSRAAAASKTSGVKKVRGKAKAITSKQTNREQAPRRSARLAAPSAPQDEEDEEASQAPTGDRDFAQSGGVARTSVAKQAGDGAKPNTVTQIRDAEQVDDISGDASGVAALAKVSETVECPFQGGPARLRTTLQVHQEPQAPPYLLGYRALLHLDRSSDDETQWEDAGYIDSWRIDKRTALHPNGTKDAWCRELVAPSIDETWPDMKQEAAFCLKALYTKKGQPAKKLKNPDREEHLASSSLLFVQMIYFNEGFQRQGLLRHALRSYYELLGQLPEWFAFVGVVVLVPSRPDGPRGNGWGEQDEDEVAVTLETVYTNAGYQRWVSSVVSKTRVVVMGRILPQGPELTVLGNAYFGDENMI